MKKTLLVSGAASGIGLATVNRLLSLGHNVIGIDVIPTEDRDGYLGYTADIRNTDGLQAVGDSLIERGITLDAILSVAGVHDMVSLAESDISRMERVVDVNLLGAMRLVRTFHPHLREGGRVLIVTSEVAPLSPMPFNGLYSLSKTALDCYAEALRQELNLLGQRVITLRPGAVETPLCRSSEASTRALADSVTLYREQAGRFGALVARFTGKPMSADRLAEKIARIILSRNPKNVYSVNRNPGLLLLDILPERMRLSVIKLLLNKKQGSNKTINEGETNV